MDIEMSVFDTSSSRYSSYDPHIYLLSLTCLWVTSQRRIFRFQTPPSQLLIQSSRIFHYSILFHVLPFYWGSSPNLLTLQNLFPMFHIVYSITDLDE